MHSRLLMTLTAALGLLLAGKVFFTREQALESAFGKQPQVVATNHWLTEAQAKRATELAGSESVGRVVQSHAATDESGKLLGTAYFDVRTLRSHSQCLMVVVAPDGTTQRVTVLSFDEPLEYMPKAKWYESFQGRKLDDELQLKRGVHAVTGATLTARGTVNAVREILAVHTVLQTPLPPEPKP